ncbi:MAG: class I SAM-dependent methyltransferase, partial [Alphaproteobacteria bacterium]
ADRGCRFCAAPLVQSFVDLGAMPPANYYLRPRDLACAEPCYPLHAYVCGNCHLVQLEAFQTPEQLFSDYAYFSSYSQSWLRHAETFATATTQRFGLKHTSQVIEVASNDGYLLQYFKAQGIPVLGIEPAANVANVAEHKGIPTLVNFFGIATATALAAQGRQADLLIANNVLAHVPDLNDFVAGLRIALKPEGVVTIEFPHLKRLMELNQFDTIYHEHFSYFSLLTAERILGKHDLALFDVEELTTHGGSLRLYGRHAGAGIGQSETLIRLKAEETAAGLDDIGSYMDFAEGARHTKRALLRFLIEAKGEGKSIAAYGAPAKGNTLLNYCGIRGDFLDYTVDRNPHKQGLYLPGTRIPILAPERIFETKPDYVLILPWNLKDEIMEQMAAIRQWGGRFVVPIPEVEILP